MPLLGKGQLWYPCCGGCHPPWRIHDLLRDSCLRWAHPNRAVEDVPRSPRARMRTLCIGGRCRAPWQVGARASVGNESGTPPCDRPACSLHLRSHVHPNCAPHAS
eukprot:6857451-Alexandrium_andersonii.AAC.1